MLLDDFYSILSIDNSDDSTSIVTVKINKTHDIYQGHFPEEPVTPGVVMLQILKNCVEQHFESKLIMHSVKNVKFLEIVNPKLLDTLIYKIQFQQEKDTITIKNLTSFENGISVLKCNATFVKQPQQ